MFSLQTRKLRCWIITALCGVLMLASGCSALRIGYSQAPDIVYWWMDGYLDFTSAQTPRVRAMLEQWFAWHRSTQLPDYAALLAKAKTEALADTTAARVCEWQADLVQRAHTAFDRAAPPAVDILLTVKPEQIAYLEHRYAKNNTEFRDDYLQPDPAKRAAATLKRVVERAETLYGRLDDAQLARISTALTRSPFDPELWLSERQRRQQEALQLLRKTAASGTTREQAMAGLQAYVDHLERSPQDAYRRYSDRLMAFNCAFAASLHNSTSVTQRRAAAATLAGWEGDARALLAARPAADHNN